jgi:hypothetical protein
MVKFRLPRGAIGRTETKSYRCGNHTRSSEEAHRKRCALTFKTLIEFDIVKIE